VYITNNKAVERKKQIEKKNKKKEERVARYYLRKVYNPYFLQSTVSSAVGYRGSAALCQRRALSIPIKITFAASVALAILTAAGLCGRGGKRT